MAAKEPTGNTDDIGDIESLGQFLIDHSFDIVDCFMFKHCGRQHVVKSVGSVYGNTQLMLFTQILPNELDHYISDDKFLGVFPEPMQHLVETKEIPCHKKYKPIMTEKHCIYTDHIYTSKKDLYKVAETIINTCNWFNDAKRCALETKKYDDILKVKLELRKELGTLTSSTDDQERFDEICKQLDGLEVIIKDNKFNSRGIALSVSYGFCRG